MGEFTRNFRNGRVVVRDRETGEVITETTVIEFDAHNNILTIPGGSIPTSEERALTLLILSHNIAYEYFGNIRKNRVGDDIRIAIFGEKEKEDRGFPRYELRAEAVIDAFVIGAQRISLNRSVPVRIKNISASGLLIHAGEYELEEGEQIWVNIHLEGNSFTSKYEIVRTQMEGKNLLYGCRNMIRDERQAEAAAVEGNRKTGGKKNTLHAREVAMHYEENQGAMERDFGYLRMLEMTSQVLQIGKDEAVGLLADGISRIVRTMEFAVLLNCIHRQRPQREERQRHCLNVAFLCGFFGIWRNYTESSMSELIRKSIESCMGKDMSRESELVQNILTAARTYDTRGSHPIGTMAGIPMVYLEQLQYAGMDQPGESVRGLERELARHILQSLRHRRVMLADGRTAEVLRILPNDVAHPLLLADGAAEQENDPWNLMWIQV